MPTASMKLYEVFVTCAGSRALRDNLIRVDVSLSSLDEEESSDIDSLARIVDNDRISHR